MLYTKDNFKISDFITIPEVSEVLVTKTYTDNSVVVALVYDINNFYKTYADKQQQETIVNILNNVIDWWINLNDEKLQSKYLSTISKLVIALKGEKENTSVLAFNETLINHLLLLVTSNNITEENLDRVYYVLEANADTDYLNRMIFIKGLKNLVNNKIQENKESQKKDIEEQLKAKEEEQQSEAIEQVQEVEPK